jgi:hypothetical protein
MFMRVGVGDDIAGLRGCGYKLCGGLVGWVGTFIYRKLLRESALIARNRSWMSV